MCIIGFHDNVLYKNKEPGKKNYEVLVIGYNGERFLSSFLGTDPGKALNLLEELLNRERFELKIQDREGLRPVEEIPLPPSHPIKQVIMIPNQEVPYVGSASHDRYRSCWGGANKKIGVMTAAIRHEKGEQYETYSTLVSELLGNYEDLGNAVTYAEDVLAKRKIKGVNLALFDGRDKYFIEYLPEGFNGSNPVITTKIKDNDVRTNFSLEHGFFWSKDWEPYKGELIWTQHFIRSINRQLIATKEKLSLDSKAKNHSWYEELFEPNFLREIYKKVRNVDGLEEISLSRLKESKGNFYSICAHPRLYSIGEENPTVIFKKTAWHARFYDGSLDFFYGNPCKSVNEIHIDLRKLESLVEEF